MNHVLAKRCQYILSDLEYRHYFHQWTSLPEEPNVVRARNAQEILSDVRCPFLHFDLACRLHLFLLNLPWCPFPCSQAQRLPTLSGMTICSSCEGPLWAIGRPCWIFNWFSTRLRLGSSPLRHHSARKLLSAGWKSRSSKKPSKGPTVNSEYLPPLVFLLCCRMYIKMTWTGWKALAAMFGTHPRSSMPRRRMTSRVRWADLPIRTNSPDVTIVHGGISRLLARLSLSSDERLL